MKIRKLLVTIRLWRQYRARLKRLRRELNEVKLALIAAKEEFDAKKSNFERLLAVERRKNELLHIEWASRFLQLQNLNSIGLSLPSANEVIGDNEIKPAIIEKNTNVIVEETPYYMDLKEAFWDDGRRLGKSDAEINAFWNSKKDNVVKEVLEAYSDEYSDTSN